MITFFSLAATAAPTSQKGSRPPRQEAPRKVGSTVTKALAASLLLVGTASQAATAPIDVKGDWVLDDGSAVVRVAPCSYEASRLCAIIIQEVLAPGEESSLNQIIVRDIRPTPQGQYRGQYHVSATKTLPATIKARSPSLLEMKVCMGVFCDIVTLKRKT